jgi:putative DNA primase/helicase
LCPRCVWDKSHPQKEDLQPQPAERNGMAHESENGQAPESGDEPGTPSQAAAINLTDLGNARRVVQDHGRDLRYCHPWRSWLVWDGQRWAEDDTGEAVRRVKDTQSRLLRNVVEELVEPQKDEIHE